MASLSNRLRRLVASIFLIGAVAYCSIVRAAEPPIDTVHVLLLMDTDAQTIGPGIAMDASYLRSRFESAATNDPRIRVTYLDGKDVTLDRVRQYFHDLGLAATSAVVVIYDGHGTEAPDGRHILAGKHGWIYRSTIRELIQAASPRLGVLYSASCAGSRGEEAKKTIEIDRNLMQQFDAFNGSTLEDLFFRNTGFVDLNSSESGVVSWMIGKGTLGVYAFASVLCDQRENVDRMHPDGFIEWSEASNYLQRTTLAYTSVDNDGSLIRFLEDVQAVSPRRKWHKPTPMPAWRVGLEVCTHWSGEGVMVRSVEPNSPAARAGLRRLDRIVSVDGRPIENPWHDFSSAIRAANDTTNIQIERISKLGERAEDAQWDSFRVSLPVAADTAERAFGDLGTHEPLFDVATYFRQLYGHYGDRFFDRQNARRQVYDGATLEEILEFAWLCFQCPSAPRIAGGNGGPVIWKGCHPADARC